MKSLREFINEGNTAVEDLIKMITKKVCSHLEEKHIGTFDFGGIDYL